MLIAIAVSLHTLDEVTRSRCGRLALRFGEGDNGLPTTCRLATLAFRLTDIARRLYIA